KMLSDTLTLSPPHLVTLSSPIWLLALLPWALFTWYLLTGRHTKTPVPFLNLWQGDKSLPKLKPVLRRPPICVVGVIAALLLGVIAAAQPRISQAGIDAGPVTIIVDRGITMSAGRCFQEMARTATGTILDAFGPGPTQVVVVPGATHQAD